MNGIESALHRVLAWAKPAWEATGRCAATLWHRALSLWSQIRDRHERLMDTDPRYPVALASGGAAVVKVVIANPAVVKAITVLLADLLGNQDRQLSRPANRPTLPWSSNQGTSLWDGDDWDDD